MSEKYKWITIVQSPFSSTEIMYMGTEHDSIVKYTEWSDYSNDQNYAVTSSMVKISALNAYQILSDLDKTKG